MKALIVIDMQNMYFMEGPYRLSCPEQAAANAAKVITKFRREQHPIIHIQHMFQGRASQEELMYLREFHELVKPIKGEIIIPKNYPSAFLGTGLQEKLQELQADELVIIGMMTHMCIDTTVRAAQDYHYPVTVIADACTTKDLEWKGHKLPADVVHNSIMASLAGRFADVYDVTEYLQSPLDK